MSSGIWEQNCCEFDLWHLWEQNCWDYVGSWNTSNPLQTGESARPSLTSWDLRMSTYDSGPLRYRHARRSLYTKHAQGKSYGKPESITWGFVPLQQLSTMEWHAFYSLFLKCFVFISKFTIHFHETYLKQCVCFGIFKCCVGFLSYGFKYVRILCS